MDKYITNITLMLCKILRNYVCGQFRIVVELPFKRIVGKPYFSDQLKKIIKRFFKKKWNTTWILCDSLHAWLQTQLRFIAMVSSLIAR